MATRTWQGTTGNMTTAANWGGTAPTTGDDVIINDTSIDITTGLGAVNLNSITIGERYTGNLTVTPTTGTIGTVYYRSGGKYGKFAPSTVTTAYIEVPRSRVLYIDGGTWTTTYCANGNIRCAAAAVMTTILNGLADWTIYSNATKITTLHNSAGQVALEGRNVGTYVGGVSSALMLRTTSTIADGSSGGTARLARGARLVFEGTGGTNDIIYNEGTIDHNPTKASQTITTLYEFPRSAVLEDVPGFTLTVTNRFKVGGSASNVGGAIPV